MSRKQVVRDGHTFVTSSASNTGNTCVGIAVGARRTGLIDTKNPEGDALNFTAQGWSAFLSAAKAGDLDWLGPYRRGFSQLRGVPFDS